MAGYRSVKSTNVPNTSTSYINGKPQGTVFGADMVTAQELPEMSGKFDLGLNIGGAIVEIVSSGYIKVTDGESTLEVGAGVDSDGSAEFSSIKRIRYEPGTPIYAKFTMAFFEDTPPTGDYTTGGGLSEGFGLNDSGFGLYKRIIVGVEEYGVIMVRKGVITYYPYNGILPPEPSNLNIYRVEWGYLGIAPFNLYWRDTENERWVRLHRQIFSQDITSLTKPDLPVGVFAINQGNTTNVGCKVGSYEAGTIGSMSGLQFDPAARPSTHLREFTGGSGTEQIIFAFRNPYPDVEMYNYVDINNIPTTRQFRNSIASQLLEVGLNVIGNNKGVNVELYLVDSTELTDGAWTPIDLGYSVLEVSEDVTPVLTNAKRLEIFTRGIGESRKELITTLDLLFPKKTAIFVYTTTSAAFDFTSFIKYQDLF